MKHLPPTLRENQRYLKLEVDSNKEKTFSDMVHLINSTVKDFAGDKGLAEMNPWLVKERFSIEDQEVIVRINRDFEDAFRAAITLADCKIITLKTSGTLEAL